MGFAHSWCSLRFADLSCYSGPHKAGYGLGSPASLNSAFPLVSEDSRTCRPTAPGKSIHRASYVDNRDKELHNHVFLSYLK